MIVNKINKGFETRSDLPNTNWMGEDWYVVPDNSELANKIMELYPRFNFILDKNGELIDVEEMPKTQEELDKERKEEIHLELEELDKTINRATEDLYALTKTTPYSSTKQVIDKKEELREELKTLNGG